VQRAFGSWRKPNAIEAHVSAISYNNIFYVLRKQLGRAGAFDAVKLVRNSFHMVPFDEPLLDDAIAMPLADLEDAIQAAAARRVNADYIVTRNPADFTASGVIAVTAVDFLALLASP
jgi:predicted nucleic acid-binding protein